VSRRPRTRKANLKARRRRRPGRRNGLSLNAPSERSHRPEAVGFQPGGPPAGPIPKKCPAAVKIFPEIP